MTDSIRKKQPTPSYPDIVYALEPLLQFAIYILQVLRWKDDLQRHSQLFVLSWTILCLHYYSFALTAPLWVLFLLNYYDTTIKSKSKQQATQFNYKRVKAELRDIQIELDKYMQQLDWKTMDRKRILSNKMWIGSLTFALWISLIAIFSLKVCVWFLGLLVLSWKSPLFTLARHACHRVIMIYKQPIESAPAAYQNAPMESNFTSRSEHHQDHFFCFTVVEHQRWYPLKGWTSYLLPNDRPEWSDIHHQRVPSPDQFKLPPPTTRTKNNTETKIRWKWSTDSWQNKEWEYGSYDWKCWGTNNALNKLTRRRHWVRTAVLSEQPQITAAIPMSRSNSLSTMTTSSSLSSASSLSSIDLIPSLSLQLQTKSIPTNMVSSEHHSDIIFSVPVF